MRTRLAILVSSFVISLMLLEIGLRVWSPIPPDKLLPFPYNGDRVRKIAADDTYLRFDRDLGWTLAPNQARRSDGLLFRTNKAGLRADREYELESPPEVTRLAAFGDSFTHCSEVTQGDCWVPRLERAWPGAEVLNFGVTAYGPDQAWLRYQRDGRPYHPCGVLIGYFVEDIDRVVNRFRPFIDPDDGIVMSKPRFLLDGTDLRLLPNPATRPADLGDPLWVEETLGPHDAWYFPNMFVPSPFDLFRIGQLAHTAAYQRARQPLVRDGLRYPSYGDDQEAYQVTERILLEFAGQVRSDGATPVIIVFPGKRDLSPDWGLTRPYDRLVARLIKRNISTLDLTPRFLAEVARTGIDALFEERHYSRTGNLVVADALANELPSLMSSSCDRARRSS